MRPVLFAALSPGSSETDVHLCVADDRRLTGGIPQLARVEFLGEMSNVLHSRAPLPLIPPTPFSHTGRRGSLGVLMAETGDGTQGLAKKPPPVRGSPGVRCHEPNAAIRW